MYAKDREASPHFSSGSGSGGSRSGRSATVELLLQQQRRTRSSSHGGGRGAGMGIKQRPLVRSHSYSHSRGGFFGNRISLWVSGLAVLVLVWIYLRVYGHGYGYSLRNSHSGAGLGSSRLGQQGTKIPLGELPAFILPPSTTTTTLVRMTKPTASPGKVKGKGGGVKATAPAVELKQGVYIGTTNFKAPRFKKSVEAFRGIPYAQTTGGENRFRPPQPLKPSTETFQATEYGQFCPINDGVVYMGQGEDCLNLNVYRPAGLVKGKYGKDKNGNEVKLPVVVYIHGGGFNAGKGIERNMASFVAWAEHDLVAVNFNYRVGALGFLPSDVTAREGILNLGLRDQQALLEWVQDNIGAFGGDKGNVTIMGLSAGAHSIGHHIMHYANSTKPPPFHKAILESGATTARAVFYPTHPRHLVQFREFLTAINAAHIPESEIFSHLRKLPLETIIAGSKAVWDKYVDNVTWPFQPVIDGPNPYSNSSRANHTLPDIIPDLPINSWLHNNHLQIPIITGYNTNEGTIFIPPDASTNSEFRSFFKTLIPTLKDSDLDQLENLYPDPVTHPHTSPYLSVPKGKGAQWTRLDTAYSHYAYICPVLHSAHFMTLSGIPNVYVYRYAATGLFGAANHGDEAPVVAHDMGFLGYRNERPGLMKTADEMISFWSGFIASKAGDVNVARGNRLEWPGFVSPFNKEGWWKDRGKGKVMVFGEGNNERDREVSEGRRREGTPAGVETLGTLEREACEFWWGRVGLSQGLGKQEASGKAKL
ncbi:Alpha/Beta hydrolase protein [Triangularia verruculosa]|uniref:Alpha/Beta hydrolase protein n=1 Tax=Triangularia verruculosa TaxID=2587418 RepID=A0AAN7ASQ6_9PEZI|nr:Alpha/Beta hydrolase protein [Triangularia verruculosa]